MERITSGSDRVSRFLNYYDKFDSNWFEVAVKLVFMGFGWPADGTLPRGECRPGKGAGFGGGFDLVGKIHEEVEAGPLLNLVH